jgi:hypothetical protein
MFPADWEEFLAKQEKEIKQAPNPPRRRQPKVTRHMSARMRRASSQTSNRVRAIYTPESVYNTTPTKPETWRGTLNLGGNCEPKTYFSTKTTQTRLPRSWR